MNYFLIRKSRPRCEIEGSMKSGTAPINNKCSVLGNLKAGIASRISILASILWSHGMAAQRYVARRVVRGTSSERETATGRPIPAPTCSAVRPPPSRTSSSVALHQHHEYP